MKYCNCGTIIVILEKSRGMRKMRDWSLMYLFCVMLFACQGKAQESSGQAENKDYAIQKTDEQWRQELTADQYRILREAGTEPKHSSPLIALNDDGQMVCAACGNPLFDSAYKYTTTSGWPSFDRAIDGAVTYANDYKLGYKRVEVLCAQCGSHLGHVFNDGPRETTGKRYCIDGLALEFIPDEEKELEK